MYQNHSNGQINSGMMAMLLKMDKIY